MFQSNERHSFSTNYEKKHWRKPAGKHDSGLPTALPWCDWSTVPGMAPPVSLSILLTSARHKNTLLGLAEMPV